MIDETLRSLAGAGTQAIRTLPLLSRLFGGPARLDLNGRVVFITGAARGLGAEIARQSHARGASVALVGRRLDPLQEFANELGERAAAFQADVTDFAALQRWPTPAWRHRRTQSPASNRPSSNEPSTSTFSANGAPSEPRCRR